MIKIADFKKMNLIYIIMVFLAFNTMSNLANPSDQLVSLNNHRCRDDQKRLKAYNKICEYVLEKLFTDQMCCKVENGERCMNYVSWRTVHYINDPRPYPDYRMFLTCARHVCECHNPDYVNDSIGFCHHCEEKFCGRCGHGCECRPL